MDKYVYRISVRRVIDGDTLEIDGLDLGFGCRLFGQRGETSSGKKKYFSVRLLGVNAPECRRGWWSKGLQDEEIDGEIARGREARRFVRGVVTGAVEVLFRSAKSGPDNFGRLLGDIEVVLEGGERQNLADLLLKIGLARKS